MESTERQQPPKKPAGEAAAKQKSTPRGLLLLFALLILVGYQTLKMNNLSSFDLTPPASSSSSRSIFAIEEVGNFSALLPSSIQTGIRRIKRANHLHSLDRVKVPLSELTKSMPSAEEGACVDPMIWQTNKEVSNMTDFRTAQRIPLYIHQTSKSRCIHCLIHQTAANWKNLAPYEYYFHDDDAMWRLIDKPWPEFPHLYSILRCLKSMTAVTDIWRLLVLWEYGGIYSDIDAAPQSWTPDFIKPWDDAYFVVEHFHAPSQYFMAAAPRHPVVFYAIHQALSKIMRQPNVQRIDASHVTGPFALLDGFAFFMLDVGELHTKPVRRGFYQGRYNRSITIDGFGGKQSDDIIEREVIPRGRKIRMYRQQNMTHFLDDWKAGRQSKLRGRSCYAVAYDLLIGPPSWFVTADNEDRMTVGGYS